jgi:predicted GIY-YIG superfamily endonuclease
MKYSNEQIVEKYHNDLSENEIQKLEYNLVKIKKYIKWKNRLDNIQYKYKIDDFINCMKDNGEIITNTLSLEFYKQNYGTLNYREIHLKCKSLIVKKRGSQYDIENVSKKRGISIEEAAILVSELKNKTNGSIENFIKRHGEEKGREKFAEFANKSKSTKENFKQRYGDSWEEKWENFLSTRDSSSLEYWIKKLGEEEGAQKHENLRKEFSKSTKLEYFKEKYGDIEGQKEYERINLLKANTKDDLKAAGYSDEQIANISMRKSIIYNNLKNLYGDQAAEQMYKEYKKTKNNPFPVSLLEKSVKFKKLSNGPVSKASVKFFKDLEIALGRSLKYGQKNDELMLFDADNKKAFFYDCLDIETNTIIEYNGSAYHADDRLSPEERLEWCNPWGRTWQESRQIDKIKQEFALKNGYKVIVVWDYEVSGKKRAAIKILEIKKILCK